MKLVLLKNIRNVVDFELYPIKPNLMQMELQMD